MCVEVVFPSISIAPRAGEQSGPSKLPLVALSSLVVVLLIGGYVLWVVYRRHRQRKFAHQVRLQAGKDTVEVDHYEMGEAMGSGGEWLSEVDGFAINASLGDKERRGSLESEHTSIVRFDLLGDPSRCDENELGSGEQLKNFDPIFDLAEEQRRKRERRRRALSVTGILPLEEVDQQEAELDDGLDQIEGQQQNALIFARVTAAKERGQHDTDQDLFSPSSPTHFKTKVMEEESQSVQSGTRNDPQLPERLPEGKSETAEGQRTTILSSSSSESYSYEEVEVYEEEEGTEISD